MLLVLGNPKRLLRRFFTRHFQTIKVGTGLRRIDLGQTFPNLVPG